MFRIALFILAYFEDKLLGLHYETMVQFLGELPKTDFFSNPEVEKQFYRKINEFNVTQELLDELNREHAYICTMSNECNNTGKMMQKPFKHFIPAKTKIIAVYFPN